MLARSTYSKSPSRANGPGLKPRAARDSGLPPEAAGECLECPWETTGAAQTVEAKAVDHEIRESGHHHVRTYPLLMVTA